MLSKKEKIIILQSVQLFADTPATILTEVADLLQELVFGANETIFAQGDFGDALYIIVSGRVHVQSGGRTLSIMEKPAVFGEMAALDPEPRSATVSALEETHLLRLDREPLYRLMASRGEIAYGIIHHLCQHLRARTHTMVEDYHYLQQVARLTETATAVEAGIYHPEGIDEVTQRTDALGQLARVFQGMIREIAAREERLHQQVQQLRIEIDRVKMETQVAEITESDYFQKLQEKARRLRTHSG